MKIMHHPGELIAARYQIHHCLGRGGMGITYQALDLHNNQTVALKCLSMGQVKEWKSLELFEREAQILANLSHPAIPKYLNYFQVDTESSSAFYLVQDLASGQSLYELCEQGWRLEHAQLIDFVVQILDILIYLQNLIPPVIHRDIKPQNIIRDHHGRVMLVDFGAVRDTYHQSLTGGSTIVGTYGYMAPEQFRGQAVLSTDLYGLGATIVFLLTGQSPSELPQRRCTIDFRAVIQPPADLSIWLDRMLSPTIEGRFRSAAEALAVLRGTQPMPAQVSPHRLKRPSYTGIQMAKSKQKLEISMPPTLLNSPISLTFGLFPVFVSALGLFTVYMLVLEVFGPNAWLLSIIGLPLLIYFWKMITLSQIFSGLFHTSIEISSHRITITRKLGLVRVSQLFRMATFSLQANLGRRIIPFTSVTPTFCRLTYSDKNINFGLFLVPAEQAWLIDEIQEFLAGPDTKDYRFLLGCED